MHCIILHMIWQDNYNEAFKKCCDINMRLLNLESPIELQCLAYLQKQFNNSSMSKKNALHIYFLIFLLAHHLTQFQYYNILMHITSIESNVKFNIFGYLPHCKNWRPRKESINFLSYFIKQVFIYSYTFTHTFIELINQTIQKSIDHDSFNLQCSPQVTRLGRQGQTWCARSRGAGVVLTRRSTKTSCGPRMTWGTGITWRTAPGWIWRTTSSEMESVTHRKHSRVRYERRTNFFFVHIIVFIFFNIKLFLSYEVLKYTC